MIAKDVMQTNVVCLRPDTKAREIIGTLMEQAISGAPVLDQEGELVGVVSLADCVLEAERGGTIRSSGLCFHRDIWSDLEESKSERSVMVIEEDRLARDLMTPEAFTVDEETPLGDVVDLLVQKRIHRVMVTEKKSLVGIITTVDIMEALASELPRTAPCSAG